MPVELSIIIVNWNAGNFLSGCLESIKKSVFAGKYEVIIVDNGSADKSLESVKERFADTYVIENTANLGFAVAVNQGIRASSGKYVLLLNPDTVLSPDTLQVMADFMEKNRECGVAGCRVLNPDGTLQLACRRNIPTPADALYRFMGLSKLFPNTPRFSRYNLTYLPEDQLTAVDAVSGAFLMIRREVIKRVGLLDERFFMYGEDLDWCFRVKKAGYSIYYVPDTSIIHFHGQSSKHRVFKSTVDFHVSMLLFYNKHYSSAMKPLIVVGICIKLALALVRCLFIKKVGSAGNSKHAGGISRSS